MVSEFRADPGTKRGPRPRCWAGLLTYTTYQPYDDICKPEGLGYLYGLYYTTGTAWSRPVFTNESAVSPGWIPPTTPWWRPWSWAGAWPKTPNLHVGRREGVKAFVQTSTGAIMEIPQENLP